MLAAAQGTQESGDYASSQRNLAAVMAYLQPVLRDSGYAGLLYYKGRYKADTTDFIAFPQINVQAAVANSGLRALGEVFQNNGDVAVSVERKVATIRIGNPSTAILNTKISLIRLGPVAQFNPTWVIGAAEGAREMEEIKAILHLKIPMTISDEQVIQPKKGRPHVPPVLKDMTVGQVLNLVATTFRGIVVYGECTEPGKGGMFDIDFVGLDGSQNNGAHGFPVQHRGGLAPLKP